MNKEYILTKLKSLDKVDHETIYKCYTINKKYSKSLLSFDFLTFIRKQGYYEMYSNLDYFILSNIKSFDIEKEEENMTECFIAQKNSNCKRGWKILKTELGVGSVGKTYVACCENKCGYIAKHIVLRTEDEIKKGIASDDDISLKFDNEVNLQIEASEKNLAPKVYDSWKCSHGGVIIMTPMRMTLDTFFEEIIKYQDDEYHSINLPIISQIKIYKFVLILTRKLLYQHNKLLELGICHGDLHLQNVMLSFDKKEDIFEGKFELKFIDFGQSRKEKISGKEKIYPTKDKCFDMMVVYRAYEYYLHLVKISELKFFFNYSLLLIYNSNKFLQSIINKPYVDKKYLEEYKLSENEKIDKNYNFEDDLWVNDVYFSNVEVEDQDPFWNEEEELNILRKQHEKK